MKMFGRNDELFELMAKATKKHASRPTKAEQQYQQEKSPVRSVSSHFGRSTPLGVAEPVGEFVEINGEALIVVEDDWEDEGYTEAAPVEATSGTVTQAPSTPIARSETLTRVFARTFALRKDTLAIGGALVGGLAIAMFLLGRSTASSPADTATPQVAVIQASEDPTPAPLPSEEASLLPSETEVPAVARRNTSTALAASAPRRAPKRSVASGSKFDLLVCFTTPKKGEQFATWLNESPESPISGQLSLKATSRKGSVRIKGFPQKDEVMLQQVQQISDPTGGSGTFPDATWRNAR